MGIILVFTLFLIGGWIFEEYRHFDTEVAKYEDQFLQARQEEIHREVEKLVQLIDFQKRKMDKEVREDLRERVIDASLLARQIFQENKDKLPLQKIKSIVRDQLREIHFDNGRGYYFAGSGEAGSEYLADNIEFSGQMQVDEINPTSEDKVRSMVAMISDHEEGYFRYQAPKPRDPGILYEKLSFIKYFGPFKWYIGTGVYLGDIQGRIQGEILEFMYQMHYEKGSVAIFRNDGTALYHQRKEIIGRNLFNLTGPEDREIYRELLAASKIPGGGFITFNWEKEKTGKTAPKIGYAMAYPDWQWVITMDMYTDDIEGLLQQKRDALASQVSNHIINITFLFFILTLFAILLSHYLAKRLDRELHAFTSFFKGAASGHKEIDKVKLTIREFKELAASANQMLEERHANEEQMHRLRILLSNIINSMPSILIGVDKNGKVIQWNRQAQEETGLSFSQAREVELDTVFPQLTGQLEAVKKAIKECAPQMNTTVAHEQDKKTRYSNVIIYPLIGERVEGAVIRIDDITEQVTAEQERTKLFTQLQQAQKMEAVGTLAGGIAHDFNNILTPILGYTEMVINMLPKESPSVTYLADVIKAGTRARELVKQILSFSRQTEQDKIPVLLHIVIKEALKLLRASIPATIEIRQLIPPDCGKVLADPIKMHQVLMNLCTNAYHAMRSNGGTLTVSLTPVEISKDQSEIHERYLNAGSYLKLEVSDTGVGMDQQTMTRIFDPYFTTKEESEGTGMGLAVVHGIVMNHNGHIRVSSEPNAGSTFTIFLPRLTVETDNLPEKAEDKGAIPRGNERILIVDDEKVIAMLEKKMLENLGYQVTAVTDSKEALELFQEQSEYFDLIITDMAMPHLSGVELALKVLKIRPAIPIILCTGYSEMYDEKQVKALGISHYIMKPILKKELGLGVRKVLDNALRN